jgi:hypothetical protein
MPAERGAVAFSKTGIRRSATGKTPSSSAAAATCRMTLRPTPPIEGLWPAGRLNLGDAEVLPGMRE